MIQYPEGCNPPWPHSNRGVHGRPAAYHRWYLEDRGLYWAELLRSMGISWLVLITDGDSVLEQCNVPGWGITTPLEFFLAHEIVPIVRDGTDLFPGPFTNRHAVERAAPIYANYGLRPMWICRNEPFDGREWKDGTKPPDADHEGMAYVCNIIQNDMRQVVDAGGVAGFPDGPCYDRNPFHYLDRGLWDEGLAFYTGHHYGKGRPVDYPYDDVTRLGTPLTEAGYSAALDDYADDPQWRALPLDWINAARAEQANPDLTALEDDVCWNGWIKVAAFAHDALGYTPPMAVTEGGLCPRDRAGVGADIDIRWPMTTPRMVGAKTLEMYNSDSPHFAICPWLLADDAMLPGGYVGWPYDSWVGWAYADDHGYGYEKPVVQVLQANPPGPPPPEPGPDVVAARAKLAQVEPLGQAVLDDLGG